MRSPSAIAQDIYQAWPKVYYAAEPYLSAMLHLESVNQSFGYDSGRCIVLRFLGNATSFRGPEARALKAELRALLEA